MPGRAFEPGGLHAQRGQYAFAQVLGKVHARSFGHGIRGPLITGRGIDAALAHWLLRLPGVKGNARGVGKQVLESGALRTSRLLQFHRAFFRGQHHTVGRNQLGH